MYGPLGSFSYSALLSPRASSRRADGNSGGYDGGFGGGEEEIGRRWCCDGEGFGLAGRFGSGGHERAGKRTESSELVRWLGGFCVIMA